ncbi:AbrB/MazE/SpoVT family DNA-binding domain-containing protein [uncultured Lactobacillus sp.]|uniref:AbrB/MazE/SpoVT family DNA-binding domain-containing protein n=1 Tax=uncultured Lactobacillus sp. TaxID=153152 RepID=UPI0028039185|nr:AbrB/MazE/SpoVT family DNA-binding domain-containing protein [uncultured Lactobacillus sp.]
MEQALKLRKWGNSNAIRLPKELLEKAGITPKDDEVAVTVSNDSIIIRPKKEKSKLEQMFDGYDSSQPYPFEIVDKGDPVGHELI